MKVYEIEGNKNIAGYFKDNKTGKEGIILGADMDEQKKQQNIAAIENGEIED